MPDGDPLIKITIKIPQSLKDTFDALHTDPYRGKIEHGSLSRVVREALYRAIQQKQRQAQANAFDFGKLIKDEPLPPSNFHQTKDTSE